MPHRRRARVRSSTDYTYASWMDRARHSSTTRSFPTEAVIFGRPLGRMISRWKRTATENVSRPVFVGSERMLPANEGRPVHEKTLGDEKQSRIEGVRSKPSLDGRDGHDSLGAERPGARHVGVVSEPVAVLGPRRASTPGRRMTR
jgi:hypothetical protein